MKIIERGILPEEKVYQARCTHCKSLLEFQKKEAECYSDVRNGSYLTITCPVCDYAIHIRE